MQSAVGSRVFYYCLEHGSTNLNQEPELNILQTDFYTGNIQICYKLTFKACFQNLLFSFKYTESDRSANITVQLTLWMGLIVKDKIYSYLLKMVTKHLSIIYTVDNHTFIHPSISHLHITILLVWLDTCTEKVRHSYDKKKS